MLKVQSKSKWLQNLQMLVRKMQSIGNKILSHKRVQCDQLHYAGGGKKHNYILEKKDSLIFLVPVFHSLDYKITALLLQEHIIDR